MRTMVAHLKEYNEAKKAEGFVPTLDMLIEELEERLNKENYE